MAGSTDTEEAAFLDYFINTRAPLTKYLALSTTTPNDDGTGFTEPVGNGYARVAFDSSKWLAAVGGAPTAKVTSASIVFPLATGGWGTITHVGIFAASTGGQPIRWGPLDTARAVLNGQQASFDIGNLRLKHGDPGDTY